MAMTGSDDDQILDARAAEALTGLRVATLAKMRCMGGGPVYHKLGRRVGYRRADLLQWLNERRVRNTTEAAHSVPRRLTDAPNR
jgi:predicted DNA-binding transcriptional regulator AlpA